MKIRLISFTARGSDLCRKTADLLSKDGHVCHAYGMKAYAQKSGILPLETYLSSWTKEAFENYEALVFIGATGIAVRAIAPYLKSKVSDPAVVVIDEKGEHIISLLSGHIGGGNHLTKQIAEHIGGRAIITTATDIHGRFAVDQWAKEQNLVITDMKIAKAISAAILNEQTIGLKSDFEVVGSTPDYIEKDNINREHNLGIFLSIKEKELPFPKTLLLVPKIITLGIGCRKNTSLNQIKTLVDRVLEEEKILSQSIEQICSIDLKQEESGILELSDMLNVPFKVYSAEELKSLSGSFTPSTFVTEVTGVDNVCERSAVYGSKGKLIVKKQMQDGVTVAIAMREYQVSFQ